MKSWPRIKRHLRISLTYGIAFVLILLAMLATLVESEWGSRWVVSQITRALDAEAIGVRGNLRTGLDIDVLEYRTEAEHYRAESVSLRWRAIDLLYGTLAIHTLTAASVTLSPPEVPTTDEPPEPFEAWPNLRLPLRVLLQALDVNNIELHLGETRYHWHRLKGSINFGTFHLRYRDLEVIQNDYQVAITGMSQLTYPYDTRATVMWRYERGSGERITARGSVPDPLNLSGTEGFLSLPFLDALRLPRAQAAVRIPFSLAGYAMRSAGDLGYEGVTELRGSLRRLRSQTRLTAPVIADVSISAPLVNGKRQLQLAPVLTASATWKAQTLPQGWWIADMTPPTTSGEITAKGNWQHYDVQLAGDIQLADAPLLGVRADVMGDLEQVEIRSLQLRERQQTDAGGLVMDGRAGLNASGSFRFAPTLAWTLDLNANDLNLATVLDEWPSRLTLRFSTRGVWSDTTQQVQVEDFEASGELRGIALEGKGNLSVNDGAAASQGLSLRLGANTLAVDGNLGEQLDIRWQLKAPMLDQLADNMKGAVYSTGTIVGSRAIPELTTDTRAENVSYGTFGVQQLTLQLAKQADNSAMSTLNFSAERVRVGTQQFTELTATGMGSTQHHGVQGLIRYTGVGRAEWQLRGGYLDGMWLGQFQQLGVKLNNVPRWWLSASMPIRIGQGMADIGRQCLSTRTNLTATIVRPSGVGQDQVIGQWLPNQSAVMNDQRWNVLTPPPPSNPVDRVDSPQLCLEGSYTTARGLRLDAMADSVPLRQLLYLFKTEVYFAGVIEGNAHVVSPDLTLANTIADAKLTTRNAELRYEYIGGETAIYPWRDVLFKATLARGIANVDAQMVWTGYGDLDATAQVDLNRSHIDRAEFRADFANIAPLETLIDHVNGIGGVLTARANAVGPMDNPRLTGNARLSNGSADVSQLALELKNIDLRLYANQSGSLSLTSRIGSGDGQLFIDGNVTGIGADSWGLTGSVSGSDFQFINLPELQATLTPQLRVSARDKTLRVEGDATIPWMRANIKSLPASAVRVSPDAIIIDEIDTNADANAAWKLLTNINILLGKDVVFNGFGVNGRLTGQLNLVQSTGKALFTSGFVNIENGSYKAYGQSLTIDRGSLNFQGPYDNPGIDIRASRVIRDDNDTQVGLDLSGTLQRPKSRVFSAPSVGESQAMMMLLTGRPMSEATNADASLLLTAMAGLGMESEGFINNEISRIFHIDEFAIKSDKGLEQSELWIGKYISPKLLVRYVVGIFDQAFSLGIEYQINSRVKIEAESGETKSVDVVYKVER